jgi:hypothetical protein
MAFERVAQSMANYPGMAMQARLAAIEQQNAMRNMALQRGDMLGKALVQAFGIYEQKKEAETDRKWKAEQAGLDRQMKVEEFLWKKEVEMRQLDMSEEEIRGRLDLLRQQVLQGDRSLDLQERGLGIQERQGDRSLGIQERGTALQEKRFEEVEKPQAEQSMRLARREDARSQETHESLMKDAQQGRRMARAQIEKINNENSLFDLQRQLLEAQVGSAEKQLEQADDFLNLEFRKVRVQEKSAAAAVAGQHRQAIKDQQTWIDGNEKFLQGNLEFWQQAQTGLTEEMAKSDIGEQILQYLPWEKIKSNSEIAEKMYNAWNGVARGMRGYDPATNPLSPQAFYRSLLENAPDLASPTSSTVPTATPPAGGDKGGDKGGDVDYEVLSEMMKQGSGGEGGEGG